MTSKRVLVIIPAYNEAENIGAVLDRLRESVPWADVAVVDDGSADDTAAVAGGKGAVVLRLPHNLGIGGAVQTGYKFADEAGYDIAIQLDADGQHDPTELARLIEPIEQGEADYTVGTRYLEDRGYDGSSSRRFGARLLAAAISMFTHQKITDPTSGFRAVTAPLIRMFAQRYATD